MTALTHDQARQFLEMGREQLSGGERTALDQHLAVCAPCRSYGAELTALQAAVGRVMRNHWRDARPDPRLEDKVQAQVRTQTMPKNILNNALGLAGLVVFTVVLIAFFSAQTQPTAIKSPVATPSVLPALNDTPTPVVSLTEVPSWVTELRLTTTPGGAYQPDVSRDGRHVLYTSMRDGNWDLYLLDLATLTETRLTDDPRTDIAPTWSPDGTRIAYQRYASTATGPGLVERVVMEADGSNPQVVTSGAPWLDHEPPAWSPDGTRLAFTTGSELVIVSVNEQRELRRFGLVKKQIYSPPVWFDNDQILFISQGILRVGHVATGSDEPVTGPTGLVAQVVVRHPTIVYIQEDGTSAKVIRQNLDGTNALVMDTFYNVGAVAQAGLVEGAALSPNGQEFAVKADLGLFVGSMCTDLPEGQTCAIGYMQADMPLTDLQRISWLPDGSGFVYVAGRDSQPELYLFLGNLPTGMADIVSYWPEGTPDPSKPTPAPTLMPTPTPPTDEVYYEMQRLTTSGDTYQPAVSPDGRQVLYTSPRAGNWDIYLINLANLVEAKRLIGKSYDQLDLATVAKTQRLTADSYNDMSPAWSPDGTQIAYQRYPAAATGAEPVDWMIMAANGSNPQVVARGVQRLENELPTWSPSGDRLAFTDGTQLVVVSVNERRELRRFDPAKGQLSGQPVWFDNDRILFISEGVLQVGNVATGASQLVPGPSGFVSQVMVRNFAIGYIQQDGTAVQLRAQNLEGTIGLNMLTIPVDTAAQASLIDNVALAPHGRSIVVQTNLGLFVNRISDEWTGAFRFPTAKFPPNPSWKNLQRISWLPAYFDYIGFVGFICVAAPDGQPDLYLVDPISAIEGAPYWPGEVPPHSNSAESTPTPTLPPVPQTETPVPPTIPN